MAQERMWVDPKFKAKIKLEATSLGKSVLEHTRSLAEDGEQIVKKKQAFDFRI